MRYRASRSEHGFSLVELLLVIALVAIIASVTLPALNGTMSAYRLRASADIIASELDAARVMAISRGAVYEVHFGGNQVWVVDPQDPDNPPRVPKTLEAGVTVAGSTVVFRPRGSAVGATISIKNEKDVTTSVTVEVSGKILVTPPPETY